MLAWPLRRFLAAAGFALCRPLEPLAGREWPLERKRFPLVALLAERGACPFFEALFVRREVCAWRELLFVRDEAVRASLPERRATRPAEELCAGLRLRARAG